MIGCHLADDLEAALARSIEDDGMVTVWPPVRTLAQPQRYYRLTMPPRVVLPAIEEHPEPPHRRVSHLDAFLSLIGWRRRCCRAHL